MILTFGSAGHPGLALLHQALEERGNHPCCFLVQEAFFSACRLFLTDEFEQGSLLIDQDRSLAFPDLRSVVCDGFYVSADSMASALPEDVAYMQVEGWATLIAMFDQWAEHRLFCNFQRERDLLASRWSLLRSLEQSGLPVPRALVTSDPDSILEFVDEVGEVGFKPVADTSFQFTQWEEGLEERLEQLTYSPVHFEEKLEGELCSITSIAGRFFVTTEEGPRPPEDLVSLCQKRLGRGGLLFNEVIWKKAPERDWVISSVLPFPSVTALARLDVLGAACEILESEPV